jgi:hypothetical protein
MTIEDWINSDAAVISRVDAAALLDCDPRTVGRGIDTGAIPFIQLGRRKLIPLRPFLRLLGIDT